MKTEIELDTEAKLKSWLIDSYGAVDKDKGRKVICCGGIKEEGAGIPLYCTSLYAAVELFKKDVTEYIGDSESVGVRMWPTVRTEKFAQAETWITMNKDPVTSRTDLKIITMYQIMTYLSV